MKISIVLAAGCLLASAPIIRAQTAPAAPATNTPVAAPLSAAQILEKSRQTYAAFSIYKGSCSVVRDSLIAVGEEAATQTVSSASAQFLFERGKRLQIEGVSAKGNRFRGLWTPTEVWRETTRSDGDGGKSVIKGDDIFTPIDALLVSLGAFTNYTGSSIPRALVPGKFDSGNPLTLGGEGKLLPSRDLGGVRCYIIEATSPSLNKVTTYWIEQKTFLLRRLTEEWSEQTYGDRPEIDGVKLPPLRSIYAINQFYFATSEAK